MKSKYLLKSFRYNFCDMISNILSRKTGQKCCVYGQNGIPLKKEVVDNFIRDINLNKKQKTNKNLNEIEKRYVDIDWQVNNEYTHLYRLFYFKNVFALTDFIKELYNTDYASNSQQVPNIEVKNKDLFKIELHTGQLKGLSFKDLQLAFAINTLNFKKYSLIPLKNEKEYKREIRLINIEEERLKQESELPLNERTKLKNKYDSLMYENLNIVNDSSSCCSSEGGCPCKQTSSPYKL